MSIMYVPNSFLYQCANLLYSVCSETNHSSCSQQCIWRRMSIYMAWNSRNFDSNYLVCKTSGKSLEWMIQGFAEPLQHCMIAQSSGPSSYGMVRALCLRRNWALKSNRVLQGFTNPCITRLNCREKKPFKVYITCHLTRLTSISSA